MTSLLYIIIGLLAGVPTGIVVGRFLLKKLFKDQEANAQNKVKKILKDAESSAEILKKDRLLEAKERFLQLKAEHELGPDDIVPADAVPGEAVPAAH